METGKLLRLTIRMAAALGRAHQRRLVQKDVKPANKSIRPGRVSPHIHHLYSW